MLVEFGVWGYSSAGRALRSHRRGRGFESPYLHHGVLQGWPECARARRDIEGAWSQGSVECG